jgi:hypothetical protein
VRRRRLQQRAGASAGDASAGGTGVTGNAYLGPIAGATASLFTVNPNGTNTGAAIETVTTTATGFAFTNAVTGPTRICVAGGTYLDEATNATQTNTMTLCALVGGATTEVFITPMSSFVDEIVKAQLKLIAAPTAADFTAALTAANDLVKSVYNVANPVDTLKPLFEKAEATAHPTSTSSAPSSARIRSSSPTTWPAAAAIATRCCAPSSPTSATRSSTARRSTPPAPC